MRIWFFTILIVCSTSWSAVLSDASSLITQARRIGIYIGTFDPPHLGHQKIIEGAVESGLVDIAIIIPQNLTLHKPNAKPFNTRIMYLHALYANHPQIIVPNTEMELYRVEQGYSRLIGAGIQGHASIGGVLVKHIKELNPHVELWSIVGTDIMQKNYMKIVNYFFLRKFKGLVVAVWTDDPKSADVPIPNRFGGLPVRRMELSGLPRISSSDLRKSLIQNVWPNELDTRLKALILPTVQATKCERYFSGI